MIKDQQPQDNHTNNETDPDVKGPAILYPKANMVFIKGDKLTVKAQGLENQNVYLDSNKGVIKNGQCTFIVDSKYDGKLSIAIGSKSVGIIVLPKPSFDKSKYTAKVNQQLTIMVNPTSF